MSLELVDDALEATLGEGEANATQPSDDDVKFHKAMVALDQVMLDVPDDERRSAVLFSRMSAVLRAHGISGNDENDETEIVCSAKGRTGKVRAALNAKARYLLDAKSVHVRVDDMANPEFWLELTIPIKPALASEMVLDVVDAAEVHAKSLMPEAKENFASTVEITRKPAPKRAASPTPLDEHMPTKLGRIETASHEMAKGMIDARGCVLVMGAYDDMESYQWYVVPIAKFNQDLEPIAQQFKWTGASMIEYLMQAPAAVDNDHHEDSEIESESHVLEKLLERWAEDLGKNKGYFKQRTLHVFGAICMITVDQFDSPRVCY